MFGLESLPAVPQLARRVDLERSIGQNMGKVYPSQNHSKCPLREVNGT
jgi:hypothetical protein